MSKIVDSVLPRPVLGTVLAADSVLQAGAVYIVAAVWPSRVSLSPPVVVTVSVKQLRSVVRC